MTYRLTLLLAAALLTGCGKINQAPPASVIDAPAETPTRYSAEDYQRELV